MMRRRISLDDKVVLVTGGSRGLGLLLAREFARRSCRIVICSRSSQQLSRARMDLERLGSQVLALPCDVADRLQVEHMMQEAQARFGQIDVLVNNAGIIQVGPLASMTLTDFEEAMGVMFWGTVYPTLAVLPSMRERGSGWIINITSIGGKVSVPHLLPYGAAKCAAVGFSEGLRAELAGEDISVTTVVPGLMRTGSYLNALFKGRQTREFTWFSLGSSLPLISMDAERAAGQIVAAAERGQAELIISWPAVLLARFHGLFPGFTADVLGLANRFILPKSDGGAMDHARGADVKPRVRSGLLDVLTAFGRSAAERFHE